MSADEAGNDSEDMCFAKEHMLEQRNLAHASQCIAHTAKGVLCSQVQHTCALSSQHAMVAQDCTIRASIYRRLS
jgi:hypothetical protein